MSASPDQHPSNINVQQSEQKLDQELNHITPVIGTVIQSLFGSYNGTESSKSLPTARQLLASVPQLHSVLNKINNPTPVTQDHQPMRTSSDQNLIQFDTLIETPLLQQFLRTLDTDPTEIKKAQ